MVSENIVPAYRRLMGIVPSNMCVCSHGGVHESLIAVCMLVVASLALGTYILTRVLIHTLGLTLVVHANRDNFVCAERYSHPIGLQPALLLYTPAGGNIPDQGKR